MFLVGARNVMVPFRAPEHISSDSTRVAGQISPRPLRHISSQNHCSCDGPKRNWQGCSANPTHVPNETTQTQNCIEVACNYNGIMHRHRRFWQFNAIFRMVCQTNFMHQEFLSYVSFSQNLRLNFIGMHLAWLADRSCC